MSNGEMNPQPIPKEIPWQLRASTRTLDLHTRPPVGSSISILTHVPELETLDQDFPNDRLVYLKISISLSPDRQAIEQAMDDDVAKLLLKGGPPIWVSVVDVRLSGIPEELQVITPHFLSASPLRRTEVETGVIGVSNYEGVGEGMAVGKSDAELHESFNSAISQDTAGGGVSGYFFPIPGVVAGGGGSETTTSITGGRDVYQFQDTIARQASEERRELLSHLTRVRNVLTLLSGHYLGSPYLKFVLRPRPLRTLSIDTSDPNLWQHELLRRRSVGLEGIQDFYGVAVIPRSLEGFCVSVRLRNVYVIDAPTPPLIEDPIAFYNDPPNGQEILNFLLTRYPRGTPADELDVDVIGTGVRSNWQSPSIVGFGFAGRNITDGWVFAGVKAIDTSTGDAVTAQVPYKTLDEVWLDTRRAAYEEAVSRSPLERGVVTYVQHELGVCFNILEDGSLERRQLDFRPALPSSTAHLPSFEEDLRRVPQHAGDPDRLPRHEYRRRWSRWSDLDDELVARASNTQDWGDTKLDVKHPRLFDNILRTFASLNPSHPANVSLHVLAERFSLTEEQLQQLERANVTDLRRFAQALRVAKPDDVTSYLDEIRKQLERPRKVPEGPDVTAALPVETVNAIRELISSKIGPENT
jgi:hypothetical protein